MKINQEYLKNLLLAFEDCPAPQTDIEELKKAGFDYNQAEFIFHIRLLYDNNFIALTDGSSGFGLIEGCDNLTWSVLPLRLTAQGHDFIADLRQKEVWQTVKTSFKDASISTLVTISKSLAEGYAKQKIKQLLGDDF